MTRDLKRRIGWTIAAFLSVFVAMGIGLADAQDLPDTEGAFHRAGRMLRQGRLAEALGPAREALVRRKAALGPVHPGVAAAWQLLGQVLFELADFDASRTAFQQAQQIFAATLGPDHPASAQPLVGLGELDLALGDFGAAQASLQQALDILLIAVGSDHPAVGNTHFLLGCCMQAQGVFDIAEQRYRMAVAILEKAVDPQDTQLTRAYNHLGELYRLLGEYTRAEDLLKQALSHLEAAKGGAHFGAGRIRFSLGKLYQSLGDDSQAAAYYRQSRRILEQALGLEHPKLAGTLLRLGDFHRRQGELPEAEALIRRAIEIKRRAFGPDHPRLKASYNKLAVVYLEGGRVAEAMAIFKARRAAAGKGLCRLAVNDFAGARRAFERALARGREMKLPNRVILAHVGLGLACEGQARYQEARAHLETAIELIERQWTRLTLAARANFLQGEIGLGVTRLAPYEALVRVLFEARPDGYAAASLAVAEQVKSRTFLEILAVRGAVGKGDADRSLLARDRAFQREIATLREQLIALSEFGNRIPADRAARVENALDARMDAYEDFIRQVKMENAEVGTLISSETVSVATLQRLLDPDTSLLEYFTTTNETFVWLIDRNRVLTYRLPLAAEGMVALVNDLLWPSGSPVPQRSAGLVQINTGAAAETPAAGNGRQHQEQRFQGRPVDGYRQLVAPFAQFIRTPHLLIVPHGALHKLPFAALFDGKAYWGDRHAIAVIPAAGVLPYVVAKRNPDRGRLLALANPQTPFMPLAFAETEVEAIASLFDAPAVYRRDQATESVAKTLADRADVVHFAGHGEFNERQPMQSGLLLTADDRNDGYLQVHETFGLDLKNANLVILSACETALARIRGGDDLVGLSRGFIYAGTPSLLASLWPVEDRSTALLMAHFYRNWKEAKMCKAAALQKAQQALRAMPGYAHPFFWAPFILIGDWQ